MTESTCAALTAVFPLVLLAFLSERRSLRRKLRRTRVYRRVNDWISVATILGLGWSIVGVRFGGLSLGPAIVAWVLTAISLAGLSSTRAGSDSPILMLERLFALVDGPDRPSKLGK